MRERILTFGPNQSLVGILTEPDAAVLRPDAPFFVASNVGINHRVGPNRLWVELARRLANTGFPMLRFDLAGMGDSAPRTERVAELERAVLDVGDALKVLSQKKGAKRFVPIGLCSGVDSTHTIALQDPRVVGAAFLEGYSFRTLEFYKRRYVDRLLTPRFWELYLRRKLREARGRRPYVREAGAAQEIYQRAYPTRAQLQRDYATMLERDLRLLFVFAGGMGADHGYNYVEQFAANYPEAARDARVEVEFYPQADHVYSVVSHRELLIERVTAWASSRFA